ncbi:MAG: SHOCT domain-containing protein [Thaumarchaeota archaeon]|nr:SHOCT domain-containing protein [Nitrososphaerota archaeon]
MNEKKSIFLLTIIGILVFSIIMPAYAEVTSLNIDKINHILGDEITFSGTVEEGSLGLVSIVIRDHTNEFVLLTQALIKQDNAFLRSIDINQKFVKFGLHNTTAFIFNMSAGQSITFELFDEDSLPEVSQSEIIAPTEFEINLQETIVMDEQNNLLPSKSSQITSEKKDEKLADFVDPNKDSQHYLDRYYNEPSYKDWFDRNYPDFTIEEAVGISTNFIITETIEKNIKNIIPEEIIPDVEAISVVNDSLNSDSTDSREAALFGLALVV